MAVPPPPETLATPGPIPGHPDKPALRARLRAARAEHIAMRGEAGRRADANAATELVLPHLPPAAIVAIYLSFHDEFETEALIAELAARGQRLALPTLLDRTTMIFRGWQPDDALERGPFRLRQPFANAPDVTPDIIVTPLVGFDRAGGRIGQGASHFDRAFARYPGARRLGLAWSIQEVDRLPRDPWDVPLHAVVTEKDYIAMPGAET